MTWSRRRTLAAGLGAVTGTGLLTACGGSGAAAGPDNRITVWSLENLPPRMAVTKKLVAAFEKESGIKVDLVGVDEAQLPQMIMSAAAAGNLPDVIGAVPLAQVWQMYSNELLDTETPANAVADLGERTFNPNALELTGDGDTRLAVPSDSWLQVLVYRKDLFEQAGLDAPDTYDRMMAAGKALTRKGMYGASFATDPSDVFTQQSFEDVALANNCRLIDSAGKVLLDSAACKETFSFYDRMAADFGPPGMQNVDSTRATYFSGRSAMLLWSSMVLDELAGLRADALPTCGQCRSDGMWLAENSGLVTAMQGPSADKPAQFGEITSWVVTKTAERDAARQWLSFVMDSGYTDWFRMAPEGKIPVRSGTTGSPDKFLRAWRSSEIGLDKRKPFDEVYPSELMDQLADGITRLQRWGIREGQGPLVGAAIGELPVPKAVGAMSSGQTTPTEAAREAFIEVDALQKALK